MVTLGASLLGIGLVIVSVLGMLSLAAGDQNTVAISQEAFWFAIGAIGAGAFLVALGIWRHIRAERNETQPLIREDWGARASAAAQDSSGASEANDEAAA